MEYYEREYDEMGPETLRDEVKYAEADENTYLLLLVQYK